MIDTNAEMRRAIRQMTGVRFSHIFLLDDRVGPTSVPLNISYTRIKDVDRKYHRATSCFMRK